MTRSLELSVRDGCAHAVMVGAGESYLSPFAIFLGASGMVLGLLSSLPLLLGSLAQFAAVHLLDRAPRRKAVIVYPVLAQALCWLPMFALPALLTGQAASWLLLTAVLYYVLGFFVNPAWNSWMGDLVSPALRGDYFGRRERLRNIWQLAATLVAGGLLSLAGALAGELAGFAAIFAIALAARLVSLRALAGMAEPVYRRPVGDDTFTFLQFLRRAPYGNFGRFTLYVALMLAATYLAAPFVTLYMLRDLKLSYLEFTAASSMMILVQSLTLHNWGRIGDRFGNREVLRITGLLIPLLPMLWVVATRFETILLLQAFSGLLWAGFNLSAANFLFDSVSPPKRARCVAYYNGVVHTGVLLGAVAGGWLEARLPGELAVLGAQVPAPSNLWWIFLLSGCSRLLISLLFLPAIREVREVERAAVWRVMVQVAGIWPARGLRFSVFNGVHPRERKDSSNHIPGRSI